jgi:hypothetical protein
MAYPSNPGTNIFATRVDSSTDPIAPNEVSRDWTSSMHRHIRDFVCCEAGKRKTGSCRLVIAAIRGIAALLGR